MSTIKVRDKSKFEALKHIVGKEAVENVAEAYADLYAGTGMDAEEIWEECICDFLGDINIFSESANESRVVNKLIIKQTQAIVKEQKAEPNQTRGSPDAEGKASFEGYAEDGKGKYKSIFPKGTPKIAKAKVILDYIQNVWSKKPIDLIITENGEARTIKAQFDPTYTEDRNTPTDASKLMGGNRHGTSSEQRVTLDLAEDYYQIALDSKYNYSKNESGKDNLAHKDVKRWHYFINDIYFAEYDSDNYTPYRVTINIKEKSDGTFVYSFSAEKKERLNTPRTLHAVVNSGKSTANVQPYNNSISRSEEKSTPFEKKSSGKSSRELDTEYLSAVERGDMETAQKMVDEAAKNWGAISLKGNKPTTFYHGTNENFMEFKPEEMSSVEGSYFFAENREDAAAYGDNIYEVYLSGKKLADYDNQPSEFYRLRNKRNQVAWLKERDYDGWYADMDSGGWGEISVFSPNQVKSTAPVTYDDDGNVIPLSERFNSESNDIRYSRELDALDYITPDEELEAVETQAFSNRTLLANALLDTITSSEEYKLIRSYQEEIAQLDKSDKRLAQLKKDRNQLYKQEKPNFEVIRELNEKDYTICAKYTKKTLKNKEKH